MYQNNHTFRLTKACNSIDVNQRNEPVENWDIKENFKIDQSQKKDWKRVIEWTHDMEIPLFSNKIFVKSFHKVVFPLHTPDKITEVLSTDVAFLYTIKGVHDESTSLPIGSWNKH